LSPEEIEQLKELGTEALEGEVIPLPSFTNQEEAERELEQLAKDLLQSVCARHQQCKDV
jgi:hypothetical protein